MIGSRSARILAVLVFAAVAGGPLVGGGRAALSAQQATGFIAGTVVDAATGRSLESAQVIVQGTTRGVTVGANGTFRLTGLSGETVVVRVVRIGYRPGVETVRVGATDLRFALQEAALSLEALVVTGTAGVTTARAVGNAVGKIAAIQVVNSGTITNVQSLFTSRVPGVTINTASGNVGSGGVTRIRGTSSISLSNEPLLYVDGIRVNNSAASGPRGMRESTPMSRINDFNPDDIESVEVIKGPAAATLYGTEASRGVIQIITKRGAAGEPKYDLTLRNGYNFLLNPKGRLPKGYRRDVGQATTGRAGDLLVERAGGLLIWSAYEQEKAQGRNWLGYGPIRAMTSSLSGGTDRARYFLSGDYDDATGYLDYNWQKKGSGRLNVSTVVGNLSVDAGIGVIKSKTRFAMSAAPYGIWDGVVWGHADRAANRGWYTTPQELLSQIEAYNDLDRTVSSLRANWQTTPWLTQRLTLGLDNASEANTRYFPVQVPGFPYFASFARGDKRLETVKTGYTSLDYAVTGVWNPNSDLRAATSYGMQFFSRNTWTSEANGQVFPAPGVSTVGGAAVTQASEDILQNKSAGMYVQEALEWRNKLFVTLAVRGDANSAFGQNFNYVVYPKASVSWVVNEESFWNVPWVSTLKLRGAWGKAGQQPDVIAASRLYASATGPGDVSAITPLNVGNPNLKPEVGTEIEVGFDAGMFDERVALNVTYYNQSIADALIQRPLPLSAGFPGSQFVNLGEVSNQGLETGLDWKVLEGRRFSWDLGMTLTRNQNKVVSMGGVPSIRDSYQEIREGEPIGIYTGVIITSADMNPTTYASSNAMCQQLSGPPQLCSVSAPRIKIGRQDPLWESTVRSTVRLFGNFSVAGVVDVRTGYWRGDGDVGHGHMLMGHTTAIQGYPDGRGPNPIARAYYNLSPGGWGSYMFIHKAGFARIRELSGSYLVPESFAKRYGARNASLSLAARNLWFLYRAQPEIFDRPVVDPETRGSRGTLAGQTQTITPVGASVVLTMRLGF